ncbi:MAG: thiamine pyrophosphate-dependent enzyme [Flavobacteriaceae bacterium]|nr:thiamine pyrophosphate-dependent enzyme [Flavobacteriaceae bacterium]
MPSQQTENKTTLSFTDFKNEVLKDYKIAVLSREMSLIGRREVLTGKAKFGIFGDGKEVPQLAMAKVFKNGDFRSGYYRDQTFMLAINALTPQEFFASLYADANQVREPSSAGRQMNGHFATQLLHEDGSFKYLKNNKNVSADISCTAGQMPRLLGLAQASKMYREIDVLKGENKFSENGNEIAFGTIGNASTSEGLFFETINAAGVLQVPMVMSVWDDEYGISVHAKHQTTKENISEILKGFQRTKKLKGFEIFRVNGWNYSQLVNTYNKAVKIAREEHVPVLIHVTELTQPQGHSTSGSHERYKSTERLQWEKENDCNLKMREWILNFKLQNEEETLRFVDSEEELILIEKEAKNEVSIAKRTAWAAFQNPLKEERTELLHILDTIISQSKNRAFIIKFKSDLKNLDVLDRAIILDTARKILIYLRNENFIAKKTLQNWIHNYSKTQQPKYSAHLYSEQKNNALSITEVKPTYVDNSELVDARVILKNNFETLFTKHKELLIFGEDTGKIGDVNQGLVGLQDKFGELRISDTGIREASIIGQGIGMAMRGLRPIAEIQYLDYMLYAIQTLSDDLATLRWRTFGKQKAPLIIRTRGHRLEGIWHSGSPMGALIHLLRGIYILTPRNMTKAAGFYNTLLETDEPALVIENLNGYRLKEKLPSNLGEFRTPIGVVEVLKKGTDITVLSYGSTLKIVEETAKNLTQVDINIEIIDAQSLLPFDSNHNVVKSIQKTNRLAIIDEDVNGGASAYLLDEILNKQNAYQYLDSKPLMITAKAHRPAYGSDGDYFSKPNSSDMFEQIYALMHEVNPKKYKSLY